MIPCYITHGLNLISLSSDLIFSLVLTPSLQPNVLVNTKVKHNKEINKGKINILKRIFTRPLSAYVSIAK